MNTPTQPIVPRIFVSHSHKDNEFVGVLVQDLRRILGDDRSVWYDALGGLRGGDTWWSRIVQELTTCDTYILVLSSDAMNSDWVCRELDIAINERKRIVPVLYRSCDIRADLKTIQHISFLPPTPYAVAFNELVAVLKEPIFVEAKKVEEANLESDLVRKMTPQIEAAFDKGDWPDVVRKADYLIKHVPAAVSSVLYRLQGLALFREGKWQQAQESLNSALALAGDHQHRLTLLNDCIDILILQGQWAEVLYYVDEALGLDPANPIWLKIQKDARSKTQTSTVNQYHLNILKQGVVGWNEWRKKNPRIYPDLGGADLNEADLSEADLSKVNLNRVNLSEANLSEAELTGTTLTEANLSKAILIGADLSDAIARDADFSGADLSRANLSKVNLSGANLCGANLSGTNFHGVLIDNADISGATVNWTIFGDIDLRTFKGLEAVVHKGPSTIGTDTLTRSYGDIPEIFLRGAGVTDTFITYIHSLSQKPIEYYSCFISYSSIDTDFAKRLYADLQSQNIRCWFAPEDMKIGDIIRPRIDESIRIFDKLLVVLSEHSIASAWVEHEVSAGLKKEQGDNKFVLFPIMLDTTVMQTDLPWAVELKRSRHIGDFVNWKNHDEYQKAFSRLLRDLKAGE